MASNGILQLGAIRPPHGARRIFAGGVTRLSSLPWAAAITPSATFSQSAAASSLLRQRQTSALGVIEREPRYELGGDLLHNSWPDFEREQRLRLLGQRGRQRGSNLRHPGVPCGQWQRARKFLPPGKSQCWIVSYALFSQWPARLRRAAKQCGKRQ